MNLLLAVLEKRLGLKLAGCDAYINLAGGMRLNEPAIDLAIVAAVISSYRNAAVESDTMIFGEVGLTEVRAVSQAEQRVREAEKLGFKVCCIPQSNMKYIRTMPAFGLLASEMSRICMILYAQAGYQNRFLFKLTSKWHFVGVNPPNKISKQS